MAGAMEIVRRLLDDFNAGDLDGMRRGLAADLRAYVTNADGGVDEVDGAEEYLARIDAMDLPSAEFNVAITQIVEPRDGQVMAMVEVHAARGGHTLHNFATHLFTLEDNVVAEWWMVEALPAASDAFWSE